MSSEACAPVAQGIRALACGARGRRFKSSLSNEIPLANSYILTLPHLETRSKTVGLFVLSSYSSTLTPTRANSLCYSPTLWGSAPSLPRDPRALDPFVEQGQHLQIAQHSNIWNWSLLDPVIERRQNL